MNNNEEKETQELLDNDVHNVNIKQKDVCINDEIINNEKYEAQEHINNAIPVVDMNEIDIIINGDINNNEQYVDLLEIQVNVQESVEGKHNLIIILPR